MSRHLRPRGGIALRAATFDHVRLRNDIIEEEQLHRLIASEVRLKQTVPEAWRSLTAARMARNRERRVTNERLTSLGMKPLALEPSLAQQRRRLKRLEMKNRSAIDAIQRARRGAQATRKSSR